MPTGKQSGGVDEALKRALRFLAYCPRSEAEVRAKLSQVGFNEDVVAATLERLRSLKFLDDERFARDWARSKVEDRGYGPLRIKRELKKRGISVAVVDQVIKEAFGRREGKDRARLLLEKRYARKDLSDPKILRRAVSYLQRRGYRDSVIAEVLRLPLED